MNVYCHWLSPLSFVLALKVITTSSTLLVASLVVNPTFAHTITSLLPHSLLAWVRRLIFVGL